MLKFQKNTMIALYAMMELAKSDEDRLATSTLAERFHASVHHLSKVLQRLVHAGLVQTTRGAAGGYGLAQDPKNITLYDVVEIFEGPHEDGEPCLLFQKGRRRPQGPHCLLHPVIVELDEQIAFTLRSISLKTLVRGTKPRTRARP